MKLPLAFVISGLLLAASAASAADRGAYIGAGAGQFSTNVDDVLGTSYQFDEDTLGFKIFGGYKFFPWLSVEGAFVDGADPEVRFSDPDTGESLTLGIATQSIVASAVFTLPLGDSFELFAKPGFAYWSSKTELTYQAPDFNDRASFDDDGTAFTIGAGMGFTAGNAGLRLEYEWFEVAPEYDSENNEFDDELDASGGFLSLSVIYSF